MKKWMMSSLSALAVFEIALAAYCYREAKPRTAFEVLERVSLDTQQECENSCSGKPPCNGIVYAPAAKITCILLGKVKTDVCPIAKTVLLKEECEDSTPSTRSQEAHTSETVPPTDPTTVPTEVISPSTVTQAVTTHVVRPAWTDGTTISDTVRCDSDKCVCAPGRELKVTDGQTFYTCHSLLVVNSKWLITGELQDNRKTLSGSPIVECVVSIREGSGPLCPLPIVISGGYTKDSACEGGAKQMVTAKGVYCMSDPNAATCTSEGYLCENVPFALAKVYC